MEWKNGVKHALEELIENQKHLNLTLTQLNNLYDLSNDIEDPFTLLVAGEFKSGKSSFINAILGEEILTSDVNPATAVLTKIKYGKKKQLIAHFKNGSIETFPIDRMNELTAESDDSFGSQLRANITMVEVELPIDKLKHVTLVDSPGLQAGIELHKEVTESFLTRPDYVLWVFDFFQVGKATEIKVLKKFREMDIPVAGVINKIDLYNPDEQSMDDYYDFVNRRLHGLVTNLQGISAKNALRGKQTNSEELLRSSRWGELEEIINSIINDPVHKAKRTYERLSGISQMVYQQLIEKKPAIPGYTDFLIPFHKEDYPIIKELRQNIEEQLNYYTDYQNELIALTIQPKKSMDDLFLSFVKLYSTFEKIDIANSDFTGNLEHTIYLTNKADKMLQNTLNTIATYDNEKLELEQLSQALKEDWEDIKDAKFFKKKKTLEFQLALNDYQKKNEATLLKYNEVIFQKQILVSNVKKIKHQLEYIINDLLIFLQKQKQIACNKWNADLGKYTNKYRLFTPDKIKRILQWLHIVDSISNGLLKAIIENNSYISDIDSYKDYTKHQRQLNKAADVFRLILPIFEEFEHFYTLESVQPEDVPEIYFELDINSVSFINISRIEKLPNYRPSQVLQRIELNRKKFIVSTFTSTLILTAAYLLFLQ